MSQKIKIAVAAAQYGRTTDALRAWITRWNRKYPHMAIRRHPGYVDAQDLRHAMDEWDRRYTPALRVAQALSGCATTGRASS